jgi:hypothetical protein
MSGKQPRSNLYTPRTKGYYIYKVKDRHDKFLCQRKFDSGFIKSWTYHTLEECIQQLNNCPSENDIYRGFSGRTA